MIYTDTLQTAIMLVGSFILTGFGKWGCGGGEAEVEAQGEKIKSRVSACLSQGLVQPRADITVGVQGAPSSALEVPGWA